MPPPFQGVSSQWTPLRIANKKKRLTAIQAATRLLSRDANPAPIIAIDTGSIAEARAHVKNPSSDARRELGGLINEPGTEHEEDCAGRAKNREAERFQAGQLFAAGSKENSFHGASGRVPVEEIR